jgi:ATP/maltotriose-dependent transcriptional regulator MalT
MKRGDLDLRDADLAATLVDQVSDPLVVSSFQSVYSVVLGLVGRYEEAIEVAHEFRDAIRSYRLDFAMPYALCAASLAEAGLRQWAASEEDVSTASEIARKARDGHAQQLCLAQWMRVLVQQGRSYEALDLEIPTVRAPLPAAQAEVMGSRALAMATAGRTADARRLIENTRGLSRAVEPAVLIAATEAICGLKEHRDDALELASNLLEVAFTRGALDVLVTSYRASPELLRVLLRMDGDQARVGHLLRQVRDADLAEAIGYSVPGSGDRRKALSPREREVYDLLVRDLTNREIAKMLFIEESTVKVHTHHIYEKLGVRSRRALIVQAMLEQSPQATSATSMSSDESS